MPSPVPAVPKKFLIIDDIPEMCSSLRTQLSSLGHTRVTMCATARVAVSQLEQASFDVILCDYYLGGGADGQQLLEYLRTRRMISRATVFIMITAEQGYANVVAAVECLPDDYLIKPFTAESLKVRLEHCLDKKTRLAKIDALQDQERWAEVIAACDELIASHDRYQTEARRIRGNALIESGCYDEAKAFYQRVLDIRVLPWARFGLARAQYAAGELDACRETLLQLIDEAPQLLAAYDLLGRVHLDFGDPAAALEVFERACEIAPDSLSRQRAIARVAEGLGDMPRVERALARVVKRTRNSPLRETADVARLGYAYAELGDTKKALELIDDAKKNFRSDAADPQLAAVEALAWHRAGKADFARAALGRALAAEPGTLAQDATLALARACLAMGRQEEGEALLKTLVQNHPDSPGVHQQVIAVVCTYGSRERAEALIREGIQEVVALNNEAVRRGLAGEYALASQMLTQAAKRLPGNVQTVANAAFALLVDIYSSGPDATKLRDALRFQKGVLALDPNHPKLAEIAEVQRRIRTKYGQAA